MYFQRGYSLVELVVGLAVMVAVTMLATPAFKASMGNSQIRTIAESIRNGLQQARVEAIKRNTKIKFTLATDSSWQFGCDSVTAACPAVIAYKSASEGAGTNLTISANAYTVIFSGFGTRDAASAASLSEVTVSNSGLTSSELKSLRVTLAAGGYSRVCDPAVSIPGDPRKC